MSTTTSITLAGPDLASLPSEETFTRLLEKFTNVEVGTFSGFGEFVWNLYEATEDDPSLVAQVEQKWSASVTADLAAWSRHFPALTITHRAEGDTDGEAWLEEFTYEAGALVGESVLSEVDTLAQAEFEMHARAFLASADKRDPEQATAGKAILAAARALGVVL